MAVAPPSGQQHQIAEGGYQATVVEVGGGLRELSFDGRALIQGYDEAEICQSARGQLLIPWPNRIDGGRYRFAGTDQQLAITEPPRNCAIHGLARWANWQVGDLRTDAVTMRLRLHSQAGWPFVMDLEASYELGTAGLAVTVRATNVGAGPALYGNGAHPYLTVGTDHIDSCLLEVPAATHVIGDERGLPVGKEAVAGTKFDFRIGRAIGDIRLDDTFTDLTRDTDGRAWAELTSPDGAATSLWVDESYPWLQVFTGDHIPRTELRRTALGLEPMSCPANAYTSGEGLIVLQPGEATVGRWGIAAGPRP